MRCRWTSWTLPTVRWRAGCIRIGSQTARRPNDIRRSNSTTHANEAYRTLKTPVLRARHLLGLRGIDIDHAGATMPAAFLAAQIEWREALGDARAARDEAALQTLGASVREHAAILNARLGAQLDGDADDAGAVQSVLQLMFIDKLVAAIDDARDELEA